MSADQQPFAASVRAQDPPEEWLVKAWNGDVLVDLIFSPRGVVIDDAAIARGEEMSVLSMQMRVMAIDRVVTNSSSQAATGR